MSPTAEIQYVLREHPAPFRCADCEGNEMTDRELLELAAKAFGNAPDGFSPLTNDGDAMRLAVKLQMKLECMVFQLAARTFNNQYAGCADSEQYPNRDFNPDPCAATRRAIVRAAAEIGKEAK